VALDGPWLASDKQGTEPIVDGRFHYLRRVKGLTQPYDPRVSVNLYPYDLRLRLDSDGLDLLDSHLGIISPVMG
jgi:hypothetical protein